MWSNTSELDGALRDAGLGEWAPRLAQLVSRCIILVPGPLEEGAHADDVQKSFAQVAEGWRPESGLYGTFDVKALLVSFFVRWKTVSSPRPTTSSRCRAQGLSRLTRPQAATTRRAWP